MKSSNGNYSILLLEEDSKLSRDVTEGLAAQGYGVLVAASRDDMMSLAVRWRPIYCVLGLALRGENRLQLISSLHSIVPNMQIVVVTAYGSVATAVAAMKCGAKDYLVKPFRISDVMAALRLNDAASGDATNATGAIEGPLALRRIEWEYIQRVLTECDGNISKTAKCLNVHRRTLQRKLSKYPVPERARISQGHV
jgi:two-component system, response regulator RegA